MEKMKSVGVLFSVVFLLVIVSVHAVASIENIYIEGPLQAPSGSNITFSVHATGMNNVGSLQLDILYDPSVIQAISVDRGDTPADVLFTYNVNNSAGIVTLGYITTKGMNGSLVIANISFKVVGSEGDSTDVNIFVVDATDTQNNPINVTSVQGITFSVGIPDTTPPNITVSVKPYRNEVNINITSDEPTLCNVTVDGNFVEGSPPASIKHVIFIGNLDPGKTYNYTVICMDGAGNIAKESGSFTTLSLWLKVSGNAKILWNKSYANITDLEKFGDFDGDGLVDVLISAAKEGKIVAFKGNTGDVLWEYLISYEYPFPFIYVKDFNMDGKDDVLILDHNNPIATLINGANGAEIWQINVSGYIYAFYPWNTVFSDLDNDGKPDIVSFGASRGYMLVAIKGDTGAILWTFNFSGWLMDVSHYFKNIKEDLNNDNINDIIAFISNYPITSIVAISGKDGSVIWSKNISSDYGGIWFVDFVEDVNGDGISEILTSKGILLSGKDGSIIYTVENTASGCYRDYNSDSVCDFLTYNKSTGILKLVSGKDSSIIWSYNFGVLKNGYILPGSIMEKDSISFYLSIYNYTTKKGAVRIVKLSPGGNEIWKVERNITDYTWCVPVGDLNGDGTPDGACISDTLTFAINGANGAIFWEINRRVAFIGDFDGDGTGDILVPKDNIATGFKNADGLRGSDRAFIFNITATGITIFSKSTERFSTSNDYMGIDLNGDGTKDVVVLLEPYSELSSIYVITNKEAAAPVQPPAPSQDTTPPSITIVSPANDTITKNSYVYVKISANEPLSSATLYFGRSVYNMANISDYIWAYNVTSIPDGTYWFYVEGYDKAGNMGKSGKYVITIDTTPPEIEVEPRNNSIYLNKYVVINVTSNEPLEYALISIDNAGFNPMHKINDTFWQYSVTLDKGDHSFEIKAKDKAGNEITKKYNIKIVLPAKIIVAQPKPLWYETRYINITVYTTSPVSNWSFNLNGVNYTFDYTNETFANASLKLEPGRYYLVVYAVDKYRNITVKSSNISFVVAKPWIYLSIISPYTVVANESFNATFKVVHMGGVPLENETYRILIYNIDKDVLVSSKEGEISHLYRDVWNVTETLSISEDGLYNITFVVGDNIRGRWFRVGSYDLAVYIKAPEKVVNGTNATVWVYVINRGTLRSKPFNLTVELPTGEDKVEVKGLWPYGRFYKRYEVPIVRNVTINASIDIVDSNISNNEDSTYIEVIEPYIKIVEIRKPKYDIWAGSWFYISVKYRSNVYGKGYAVIELPEGLYLPRWQKANKTIYTDPNWDRWVGWSIRVNKTTFGSKGINITLYLYSKSDKNDTTVEIKIPVVTVKSGGSVTLKNNDTAVIYAKTFDVYSFSHFCNITILGIEERILKGLEYLIEYPHGCVEQTTSPTLAAYKIWKYYRDNNVTIKKNLRDRMNETIIKGLERLRWMQRSTGTWDVWGGEHGEDALPTLYALYGIARMIDDPDFGSYVIRNFDIDKTVNATIDMQRSNGAWKSKFGYGTYFSEPVLTGMALFNFNLTYSHLSPEVKSRVDSSREKAVSYLLSSMVNGTCWRQLSWDRECDAYTTAFAVIGLIHSGNSSDVVKEAIKNVTKWLMDNQEEEGYWTPHRIYKAWGAIGSRSEATALAMQALIYAYRYEYISNPSSIERAKDYLIGVYKHRGSWGYTKTTQEAVQALIKYSEILPESLSNITLSYEIVGENISRVVEVNSTNKKFSASYMLPLGKNYTVIFNSSGNGTVVASFICMQEVPLPLAKNNVPREYIDPLEENVTIEVEVGEGYANENIPVNITIVNPTDEPIFMPIVEIPFIENATFNYSGEDSFCMGRENKPICEKVENNALYIYPVIIENKSSYTIELTVNSSVYGNRTINVEVEPMYNPGLITVGSASFYVKGYGNATFTVYDGYANEIDANITLGGRKGKKITKIKEGIYNVTVAKEGYVPVKAKIYVKPGENTYIVRLYKEMKNPEVVLSETDTRLRSVQEVVEAGYRNFTAVFTSQGGLAVFAMEVPEGYEIETAEINGVKATVTVDNNTVYASAELSEGANTIKFSFKAKGEVQITEEMQDKIIQNDLKLENYTFGVVDIEELKFETLPNGSIEINESKNASELGAREINETLTNIKAAKYIDISVPAKISYAVVRFYYYEDEIAGINEDTLKVYRWINNTWSDENITIINRVTLAQSDVPGRGYIVANLTHFSVFGIAGEVVSGVAPAGGGGGAPEVIAKVFNELTKSLLEKVFKAKNLLYRTFVEVPKQALASLLSIADKTRLYPYFEELKDIVKKEPEKIEGDIYEITAEQVLSKYTWVPRVIIARGDLEVDSYAALALAKAKGAPILLTKPDELPEATLKAIEKLKPKEIIIVGGPKAVSENVEAKLKEYAKVTRLWGATRIETSVEIAKQFAKPKYIVIANWSSSEKAAYIAYLYKAPVLYVKGDELPEAVEEYLKEKLKQYPKPKIVFVDVSKEVEEKIMSL